MWCGSDGFVGWMAGVCGGRGDVLESGLGCSLWRDLNGTMLDCCVDYDTDLGFEFGRMEEGGFG